MKRRIQIGSALACLSASLVCHGFPDTTQAAETAPLWAEHKALSDARTEWLLAGLFNAYQKSGHQDPKWDKPVTNALISFALMRGSEGAELDLNFLVRKLTTKAIEAGSDDPMLDYFQAREDDLRARTRTFDVKPVMRSVADRLFSSGYPALCKLNAAIRAASRVKAPTGGSEFPPELVPYRQKVLPYFHEVLGDKSTPPLEVYDSCRLLFDGLQGDDAAMESIWKELEPALGRYSTNASLLHLIKGRFLMSLGWDLRAITSADAAPGASLKKFGPRFEQAAAELETAWKLNPGWPEIAMEMMTLERNRGRNEAQLELWFQRAMDADPNNYQACVSKLTYLDPLWGGTEDKMLAFGRQCALSTQWSGEVTLILEKAHDRISKSRGMTGSDSYWKNESIWNEIKAAFDKYYVFRTKVHSKVPDIGSRSRLVRVAYRSGHYDDMVDLVRGMKEMDYDLFGGQAQFLTAFRYANSKSSRPMKKEDVGNPPKAPAKTP